MYQVDYPGIVNFIIKMAHMEKADIETQVLLVPVSKATKRLNELMRRAETGESVFLTVGGRVAVQLEPVMQTDKTMSSAAL